MGSAVAILAVAGGVALVGGGDGEADDEQRSEGITVSEFRSLPNGSARAEVRARLGSPAGAMHFDRAVGGETDSSASGISCVYYPEKGGESPGGRSFQLCFEDGRLDSKRVQ